MAESFSSSGGGPAKTNSNAADSLHTPHPLTPAAGPSYDKADQYEVYSDIAGMEAPDRCRDLDYS